MLLVLFRRIVFQNKSPKLYFTDCQAPLLQQDAVVYQREKMHQNIKYIVFISTSYKQTCNYQTGLLKTLLVGTVYHIDLEK